MDGYTMPLGSLALYPTLMRLYTTEIHPPPLTSMAGCRPLLTRPGLIPPSRAGQ